VEQLNTHDAQAAVCQQPLTAGSMHLRDLGYFNLAQFTAWTAQGVHWLTCYKTGVRLFDLQGQPP